METTRKYQTATFLLRQRDGGSFARVFGILYVFAVSILRVHKHDAAKVYKHDGARTRGRSPGQENGILYLPLERRGPNSSEIADLTES